MVIVVPEAVLMTPLRLVTAVVVPVIPTWIEFAVVVLPTVLPLIVGFEPAVSMPRNELPIVAVGLLTVMPPTLLFWTVELVAVAWIPSTSPPLAAAFEVTVIAPVPVEAPTV